MLSLGGPVWGVAVLLMLAALLVLNVVRLRHGQGRLPWLPLVSVVVGVLLVVGLVLAFGTPPG